MNIFNWKSRKGREFMCLVIEIGRNEAKLSLNNRCHKTSLLMASIWKSHEQNSYQPQSTALKTEFTRAYEGIGNGIKTMSLPYALPQEACACVNPQLPARRSFRSPIVLSLSHSKQYEPAWLSLTNS